MSWTLPKYRIVEFKRDGVAPGFGYAARVGCGHCHAPEGAQCQTNTGRLRDTPHVLRLRSVWASRNRLCALRMRRDDPRFGLKSGDILVGSVYRLDPVKWSVVERINDGFDPECNLYFDQVDWIGWAFKTEGDAR